MRGLGLLLGFYLGLILLLGFRLGLAYGGPFGPARGFRFGLFLKPALGKGGQRNAPNHGQNQRRTYLSMYAMTTYAHLLISFPLKKTPAIPGQDGTDFLPVMNAGLMLCKPDAMQIWRLCFRLHPDMRSPWHSTC